MRGVEIPCASTNRLRAWRWGGKNCPPPPPPPQISAWAAISVDGGVKWSGDQRQPGRGGKGQAAASECEPVTSLQPAVPGQGDRLAYTAASRSCVFWEGAWPGSCISREMPQKRPLAALGVICRTVHPHSDLPGHGGPGTGCDLFQVT